MVFWYFRTSSRPELLNAEGRGSPGNGFAGFGRKLVRIRQRPQQRAGVEQDDHLPAQNASASSAENGRSQASGNSNSPRMAPNGVLHKVQQARKLGLGLVNAYLDHPDPILV
jgi:hypothetical protein